ncbi:MAG TPA: exodeoxyribonuclease VII large subunit [Ruminococcus sp.]|nr:exodeoxyribonuclease VII large subunit [Ruminococcus sp.]
MPVITVSQINKYIGFSLKGDKNLQGIMVRGEISNFTHHYKSGHMYFSLKDSESSIKAVMFASAASRLKFEPEDGMSVIVSGSISVYERDGVYQLYVNDILPEGAGKAGLALEQLKKKLAAAGLFEASHKRQLPAMPVKIGAVTSLNGAAIRDIINVLSRRYPIGELIAVNSIVQGDEAPDSICRGILKAEMSGCDVVIVGRGGGSSEDLSAFNTEKVAYGIYNCSVPVISAVGHEVDYSIADLVADLRAPTPSAAAELVVPDINQLLDVIKQYENRIKTSLIRKVERFTEQYSTLSVRLSAQSPENRLRLMSERIESLSKRAEIAFLSYLERQDRSLTENIAKLEALSPLKVLARGYSLVYKGEKLLDSSSDIEKGDLLKINFGTGGAEAKVVKKW